jgi:hypothetical protein
VLVMGTKKKSKRMDKAAYAVEKCHKLFEFPALGEYYLSCTLPRMQGGEW